MWRAPGSLPLRSPVGSLPRRRLPGPCQGCGTDAAWSPLGEITESDPAALVAFIGNQRAEYHVPHRLACRVLGVSESWFYKWRGKPMTTREVRRGKLAEAIE